MEKKKEIMLGNGKKIDVDELLNIRKAKKLKFPELAKALGLTQLELREVVHDMSIDYPDEYKDYHSGYKKGVQQVDFSSIVEYISEGPKTRSQIQKHFGISETTLRKYIQNAKSRNPELYAEYEEIIQKQKSSVVSKAMNTIKTSNTFNYPKKSTKSREIDLKSGVKTSVKAAKSSLTPEEAIKILRQCAAEYQRKEALGRNLER